MKLAVLIATYNRKVETLNVLARLLCDFPQEDVFVLEDGSTDGTFEVIASSFPSINVIQGDGKLFWGRGMRLAWQFATLKKDYDGYLWVNNDSELNDDYLDVLLETLKLVNYEGIVSGALCSAEGTVLYGGKDKHNVLLVPNGEPQDIFFLNGNVVLVPKKVFDAIGFLDPIFHHHGGDFDYGLRTIRRGFRVVLTCEFVGVGVPNRLAQFRGRLPGASLIKRFRRLYSPLGVPPIAAFIFHFRHFGLVSAIKEFFFLNMINILPDSLFLRIKKIV